ncbi:MAG: hypothetical protein ACXABD_01070 [Candidatus Thorarchaeota archaeon]|jgi:hypothetical protein
MTRGIVIPILARYENILVHNLHNLFNRLGCNLPIELWQIGHEISIKASKVIMKFREKHDIRFKNVRYITDDFDHWKGWQIKAFALKHSDFDEVIICDCDILFGINPEVIFRDENYLKTGTFFFKDYEYNSPGSMDDISDRSQFIRKLIPQKKQHFPEEWNFIYDGYYQHFTHKWDYMEAGVLYINKAKHEKVVDTIFTLNSNWKETYKYIYGDKETFWLAFVMHGLPFYMNPRAGHNYDVNHNMIKCADRGGVLTHFYRNLFFFSQKGFPVLSRPEKTIMHV